MTQRHSEQMKMGHVFPEEEAAASLLLTLSWVMPVLAATSALLDLVMVFLFQKFLHPWRRILEKVRKYLLTDQIQSFRDKTLQPIILPGNQHEGRDLGCD